MRYVPALDGTRAIAALAVMLVHAWMPSVPGGFLGVDVFFVLSGYLITRLLLEESDNAGRIDLPRFYVRRLRRLYPALLLLLAVYAVLGPMLWSRYPMDWHVSAGFAAGLYVSDYTWAFDLPMRHLAHTWSLAVEEQFYLVWPVIVLGLARLPRRTMSLVLFGGFVLLTAWRCHEWLQGRMPEGVYFSLDTHAAGLVLGALGAVSRPKVPAWAGWVGLAGLVACFGGFKIYTDAAMLAGITAAELCSLLVVLAPPYILAQPTMVWLGQISYGLYLWHYPVMRLLRDADFSPVPTFLLGSAISIPLAAASYYTVEAWFRSRGRGGVRMPAGKIGFQSVAPGRPSE